jgi:hypothetical protein
MRPRKDCFALRLAVEKVASDLRALEKRTRKEMLNPKCKLVGDIRLELIMECLRSLKLIELSRKYRDQK